MRRFLLVVLAAAVSAVFLLGAAASASAGTLDQQQTNTSGSGLDAESTQTIAQTFTAGLSGKLDQVDLHLGKLNGPTAPLSIELRDVSGGLPGSTILASQSVPQPSVPASPAFVPINFAVPASVAAGTQYAILAYSSSPFPQTYYWDLSSTTNPYAGGAVYYTNSAPPTTPWSSAITQDFAFKTYVAPVTSTSSTGQRAAALKKCKKKHSARARRKCRKKAKLLPV